MLYPSLKVERRTSRVAAHGFDRIDIWDWKKKDLPELKLGLKSSGVILNSAVANTHSSPSAAAHRKKFISELRDSLEFARKFDCGSLIVLGEYLIPPKPGSDQSIARASPNPAPETVKHDNLVASLLEGCDLAKDFGVGLFLEALNNTTHPSYFLNSTQRTLRVVDKVRRKNLSMLYDIYHMQIAEGNVTETMLNDLGKIGCIHFADVPGRHEPGSGELNLSFILGRLDSARYRGPLCFEYSASGSDDLALDSIRRAIEPYLN
jgi:hydroxypyruvate isomerase